LPHLAGAAPCVAIHDGPGGENFYHLLLSVGV
jgi:hypothetical protein